MAGPATSGIEGRLGFTITVPDSWYELDLEPSTRERSAREMVEARVRGNDEMWAQRHGITKILVEQSTVAWEAGGLYTASFVTPTDDGPITGSVTVSLIHDPRAADSDTDWFSRSFKEIPPTSEEPDAPYAKTSVVDITGCGSCPRSAGIEDTKIGEGTFLRNVFTITAVPVREFDRVFLITLASPVVPLADTLLDLFDAVTSTFRWVRLNKDAVSEPQSTENSPQL